MEKFRNSTTVKKYKTFRWFSLKIVWFNKQYLKKQLPLLAQSSTIQSCFNKVPQLTTATIDDQLQAKSAQCIDYRIASSIAVQLIAYKIVN